MAEKKPSNVTMRVRIGQSEIEVTGPSDYVEKKIKEFLKSNIEKPSIPSLEQGSIHQKGEKTISAAQFFKKVNPHTDIDRALAAGYYLEVLRKMENFTAVEIKDTIKKEAKTPPPKNTNDAINKNIKKGYMMTAGDREGKMAFVLTSDGEEAIKTLLVQ